MSHFIEAAIRHLDELIEQRRRIDEDIKDLRRILQRHGGETLSVSGQRRFESSRGLPPGRARQEILDLMADGEVWTPSRLGRARGTSGNAASNTLRRMMLEKPPPIEEVGTGRYQIASPKGDAQGSLTAVAERE